MFKKKKKQRFSKLFSHSGGSLPHTRGQCEHVSLIFRKTHTSLIMSCSFCASIYFHTLHKPAIESLQINIKTLSLVNQTLPLLITICFELLVNEYFTVFIFFFFKKNLKKEKTSKNSM